MRFHREADTRLLLGLLLLAGIGAALLAQSPATRLDPRDREHYFWDRHLWQCAFDALSAVVGSGMSVQSGEYTSFGRWILVALGVAGAWLYLAAALMATRQFCEAAQLSVGSHPALRTIAPAWLVVAALLTLVCAAGLSRRAERVPGAGDWHEGLMCGLALSVGMDPARCAPNFGSLSRWFPAAAGLVTALGWPVWLGLLPGARKRGMHRSDLLRAVGGMLFFWTLVALLVAVLETPMGSRRPRPDDPSLAAQPPPARFERGLALTLSAAGIGAATEPLSDRAVGPGTQFLLGCVVLIGGLAGSFGGGIHGAIAGLGTRLVLGRGGVAGRSARIAALRIRDAAIRIVCSMTLCACIAAVGLLIIHRLTGSPFDSPPDFSGAWLDAASCTGGAALSSGLIGRVTDPNLSGGIQHSADAYQWGMTWIMLALLAGRVLPVRILRQAAQREWTDAPPGGGATL